MKVKIKMIVVGLVAGFFLVSTSFAGIPVLDWLSGKKESPSKQKVMDPKHKRSVKGNLGRGSDYTSQVKDSAPLDFMFGESNQDFDSQY